MAARATSTNGHRVIDLNKARAARAETAKQPVLIKIGDQKIELPAEVPAEFALLAYEGRMLDAVQALFGEDGSKKFFEGNPSFDDLTEMVTQVSEMYGLDEGE